MTNNSAMPKNKLNQNLTKDTLLPQQIWFKNPFKTHQKGVEWRERNGQGAKQDVREGKIGDEKIGDRLHGLVPADDVAHEHVAENAQHKNDSVEHAEDGLNGAIVDDIVGLVVQQVGAVVAVPQQAAAVEAAVGAQHDAAARLPRGECTHFTRCASHQQQPPPSVRLRPDAAPLIGIVKISPRFKARAHLCENGPICGGFFGTRADVSRISFAFYSLHSAKIVCALKRPSFSDSLPALRWVQILAAQKLNERLTIWPGGVFYLLRREWVRDAVGGILHIWLIMWKVVQFR